MQVDAGLGSRLMDVCPCLGACNQPPGSTEAVFGEKTCFLASGHPNLRSTAEEMLMSEKAESKAKSKQRQ